MSRPYTTKPLFVGLASLLGAALLAGFSFLQKVFAGVDPYMLKAYIVPCLFGGTSGAVIGCFVYRLKAANVRLAASEALQRTLLDTIDVGVFIVDDETRIIESVNRYVLNLMGVKEEDVVGREAPFVICEQGRGESGNDLLLDDRAECILVTPGKAPIPVLRSVKSITLAGESKRLETVVSISRQKRAESRLASEAQRRKVLFEKSYDGIAIIDQDHRVIEANERFASMLGYPPEEILGLHTWDYDVVKSKEEILNTFEGLTKVSRVFETVHRRKDGSVYDVEVSASGLPAGGVPLVMIICRDISGRKRYEAALVEAKVAAESASRMKSEFLANMSHEIRTPINGIMGMLQLIRATELSEEQKELIGFAFQASDRLTRLLSDILDLSKVEAGRMEIAAEPFDLVDVLEGIRQLFVPAAREKGVEFRVVVHPGVPTILLGDVMRVQQIIGNLVGNAIKFTDAGRVELDVHLLPSRHGGEIQVLFTVSDTGPGVADDQLDRVFIPFTQVDGSYQRRFQGAGLGLAICARLVDLMKGSMAVETEVGSGSSFYCRLPFRIAESSTPQTMPHNDHLSRCIKFKILVAEDDPTSRLFIQRGLEKSGHTVKVVENGRNALEALQSEHFDIVLMDIQMPVLSGLDAVRAVRRGEAGNGNRDIPVVAITAHVMEGDMDRFLEAGMSGYAAKPLCIETLQEALDAAVGVNCRETS